MVRLNVTYVVTQTGIWALTISGSCGSAGRWLMGIVVHNQSRRGGSPKRNLLLSYLRIQTDLRRPKWWLYRCPCCPSKHVDSFFLLMALALWAKLRSFCNGRLTFTCWTCLTLVWTGYPLFVAVVVDLATREWKIFGRAVTYIYLYRSLSSLALRECVTVVRFS